MIRRPSKELVRWYFAKWNQEFFGGVLHPNLPIHWVASKHFLGDCWEPGERWPLGLIRLSSKATMPRSGWQGVLLHEMVHCYLHLWDTDEYEHGPVAYHGPRFTEECNRIGAALGLEPVDEEGAWFWPHYYDFEHVDPAIEE